MRQSRLWLSVLAAGALVGCSSGETTPPPDAWERTCWGGGGTPTPGAEVEIGYGNNDFMPLADEQELPLIRGPQGGAHVFLHARIRGMSPGDTSTVLVPNPTTHFTVYFATGEQVSLYECSYPMGYRASSNDAYELPFGPLVRIKNAYMEQTFGKRVRVQVEVMDTNGLYAKDERWVNVVEADPAPDAGVPDAGMPDAGMPDAATPDAATPDADVDDGN